MDFGAQSMALLLLLLSCTNKIKVS